MPLLITALICSTLVSQSLMDSFSVLLLITLIYQYIVHKKNFDFNTGFEWLWPIWIIILISGLLLGGQNISSLLILTDWKWIVMFYVFFWSFQKNPLSFKNWNFVWIFLCFCSFYALVTWYLDYDIVRRDALSDLGRAGGLFYDPMTLAHVYGQYLCFTSGLLLTLWSNNKKNEPSFINRHFLLIYAIFLTSLVVLLSFTRGIWISCAISFLAMSFFIHRRLGMGMTFLLIATSIILFFIWPQFHDRLLYVLDSSGYDSERFNLWRANWLIFKDHPFFGAGFGEYKNILPAYFARLHLSENQFLSHAHNQYLHVLAGTGLLGFLCFMFFTIKLLSITIKKITLAIEPWRVYEKGLLIGSLGAQICFLFGGLTESNFERAKVRLVYLLLATMALSFDQTKRSE